MWLEIGSPCSLLLGLVPGERGGYGLLGITLQYPPVHLLASARPGQFGVTGARARAAYDSGLRFLEHHGLPPGGDIQIELATPSAMGLGSDAMVALSTARALAWMNDLPHDDASALAAAAGLPPHEAARAWGFQQGGLLEVELSVAADRPALVRRREIAHSDSQSWAFVFHFPHVPEGTSATLEADRLKALIEAAPRLDRQAAGSARDALWQAVEADDLPGFGACLTKLRELNDRALTAAGPPFPVPEEGLEILALMRENGAAACAQALTGLARLGLVQGGKPSLELRHKMKKQVGHDGGIVMATITDNRGAQQNLHKKRPLLQGA
jgi:predicted sugar kinase